MKGVVPKSYFTLGDVSVNVPIKSRYVCSTSWLYKNWFQLQVELTKIIKMLRSDVIILYYAWVLVSKAVPLCEENSRNGPLLLMTMALWSLLIQEVAMQHVGKEKMKSTIIMVIVSHHLLQFYIIKEASYVKLFEITHKCKGQLWGSVNLSQRHFSSNLRSGQCNIQDMVGGKWQQQRTLFRYIYKLLCNFKIHQNMRN